MAPKWKKVAELEAELTPLFTSSDDRALLDGLEGLRREPGLPLLVHRWGPELYRRNRILFRPFILSHFGTAGLDGVRWRQLEFKTVAAEVEPWLAEVDRQDDIELFRRLYRWRLGGRGFDAAAKIWREDLLARARAAETPARRSITFAKLDVGYPLDEESALALYQLAGALTGPFILKHLPFAWRFLGGEKRTPWRKLWALAEAQNDEPLHRGLYRRQIPLEEWAADSLSLAKSIADPGALCAALEERHPLGLAEKRAETFRRLLEQRGRDVLPYVAAHLREVHSGGWAEKSDYAKLRDFSLERGLIELWAAVVRTAAPNDEFDRAVKRVLLDRTLDDRETIRRLRLLGGASRELNLGPLGLAIVRQLSDENAARIYESHPGLIRGPFRANVAASGYSSYPKLLRAALECGDHDLVDYLASRLLSRLSGDAAFNAQLENLVEHYSELLGDDRRFGVRAASVLSRVPAYVIWQYRQLIGANKLARLFFERSASRYLAAPEVLGDLLEAPAIHVQALAFRVLGLADDRARRAANEQLPLLLATLLRPLHRKTRLLAFGALENAAIDAPSASRIVDKAKEALDLPDAHYPKEDLVGTIGRLLARWPETRLPSETPRIFRRGAA